MINFQKLKYYLLREKKHNLSNNLKILNNAQEISFCKKRKKELLCDSDITDAINLAIYEFDIK